MAEFEIVDLTVPSAEVESSQRRGAQGQSQSAADSVLGRVDTAMVAAELEKLRKDLSAHVKAENGGLQLSQLVISLTVTAEGGVAFIAKGSAEASIEVTFSRPPSDAAS